MNLKAGLWQQQTMKLTMTQELSQAIALLQYSTQELVSFLETKAAENPLIQLETSNVRTFDPRNDRIKSKRQSAERDLTNWLEQMAKNSLSLEEHLISQLCDYRLDDRLYKKIEMLIEHIDENGYLMVEDDSPLDDISKEALQVIQSLEPAGVGARSLQECLLLQVKRIDNSSSLAEQIVADYLVLFAEKKWKEIAKTLNVSFQELQLVQDFLQTLNPKPGAMYSTEKSAYVVPDVIVKQENSQITIEIVNGLIPSVKFNQPYYKELDKIKDDSVSTFLKEKTQDYNWLISSIEQRQETLLKVMSKIVEKQYSFFQYGKQTLKPLTMKEIADEVDLHESTVSRAVREKFVQTVYGTYPLKYFFTSSLQSTSTEEGASSQEVKQHISKMVEEENKQKPLSDQQLANKLKELGLVVSRRTIAKYRDQLNIPSSSKRKRYDG